MKFSAIVEQVLVMLQRQGRISYRALKREFDLDDGYIEALKAELIDAQRVAVDEDSKVLVWVGKETKAESENRGIGGPETNRRESRVQGLEAESRENQQSKIANRKSASSSFPTPHSRFPTPTDGERRQLTVMFCDLVGSTAIGIKGRG